MTTQFTSTYVIDPGLKEPLRFDFSWPDGATTPHALLPAIFTVADAINEHTTRALADMNKSIGCGPGCDACCRQLVPISEYEAIHLSETVRDMPPQKRSRIIQRFMQAITVLDESGLLTP